MKKKKEYCFLVTGGTGFLGNEIIRQLLNDGHKVKSISRNYSDKLKKMNVEQINADIQDIKKIEEAFINVDCVIHTAANVNHWGKYEDFYSTNVLGTINIIKCCKKNNITNFIHTSTPAVIFDGKDIVNADESYPYPSKYNSNYALTKALAEKEILKACESNFNAIILRPHIIWGPEDTMIIPRILKRAKKLKIIGNGKNIVCTIYITNAAYAHLLAAYNLFENPKLSRNIYFVTQNEPVNLWALIAKIIKWYGYNKKLKLIPRNLIFSISYILTKIYDFFNIKKEPFISPFMVDELSTSHTFNISAIQKDLNYKPIISLKEGLEITEKWVKNMISL